MTGVVSPVWRLSSPYFPHSALLGLLKSRLRELHATPQTLIPADAQDVIKAAGQATALPLRRNEEQLTSVPPKPHECLTPPTSDDSASTSIVDGAELADEVYSFTFFGMRPSGALETKDEYALAFKKDRDQSSAAKKRRPLPGDSIPTISTCLLLEYPQSSAHLL